MFLWCCGRGGEEVLDSYWLEPGLGGLEVEAPDSLGLEAELAAPEEEVEAPAAPVLEDDLAGLEVEAPDALGLEAELAGLGLEL